MKKRNFLFLAALLPSLLCGCDKNKGSDIYQEEVICEGDVCETIKSLDLAEKCPFYLDVGQEKTVSFSFTHYSKVRVDLRKFTWHTSNSKVVEISPVLTGNKPTLSCKLTAKKAGQATIYAQNDVDETLRAYYIVNVIDKKDTDYLWEYDGSSKSLFGYKSSSENPQGNGYGTAKLGDTDWTYERNRVMYLANAGGSIQFGKGCKKDERENAEDLELTTTCSRSIKKITVETSSLDGLCDFKISIGGVEKFTSKAFARTGSNPYNTSTKNNCAMLSSPVFEQGLTGEIKLIWDNPDYDETYLDPESEYYDRNYSGPGAIYLRSIYIEYYD